MKLVDVEDAASDSDSAVSSVFTVRRSALHGLVILSVCLSVRPSVTLVDCVHVVQPMIMIPSP